MTAFTPTRGILAGTGALLCLCAGSGSAAPRGSALALKQVGQRLYLQEGKARLLLDGVEEAAVPRAGGWRLLRTPSRSREGRSVQVFRKGRLVSSVSLDHLRDDWLKRDALWGPGKAGNDMRYMHQSAGGIGGFLYEAYPTSAGWVGVLSWRFFGPSGEPVGARHLVRIPAAGKPGILPVRRLRGERAQPYQELGPRLFPHAGKLLLWEAGELTELGPNGERLRLFMKLPDPSEPHTLLEGRWLVRLKQGDSGDTRIDAVDLSRRTVRRLLEEPTRAGGFRSTRIVDTDEATRTLLLQTSSDVKSGESLSLLSVPSGGRRFVRTPWAESVQRLWRGYLIVLVEGGYDIYDARTLKRVKHLRRPRAVQALTYSGRTAVTRE